MEKGITQAVRSKTMNTNDWNRLEREYWKSLERQAPDDLYRKQYRSFRVSTEFKGLSDHQRRDFDYYLKDGRKEKCYPSFQWPPSKDRLVLRVKSVEQWYWLWDTHGIECGCDEAKEAGAIVQSKAFLNMSIKMWVEDLVGGLIAHGTSPDDFCLDALPWVRKAFEEQLKREFLKHPDWGFVPTFVNRFLTQPSPC